MNRSQTRLGAPNEFSNFCVCVGRSPSAWVARPRWVAPLTTSHCGNNSRGSLCPGGSLAPRWVARAPKLCPRNLKLEIGPLISKTRFGCCGFVKMKLVWLLYMIQISSQSDFVSNLIENPYYNVFVISHLAF